MKTIHNKQGKFIKVIWNKADKKKHSERMTGKNNPFYGMRHTNKTKLKLRKSHTGKKNSNTICKHHLYLKENSAKTIKLTNSKHHILHHKAYNYLVELGLVDDYIKWFDKKYGIQ